MDSHKNFAISTVATAPDPAASGTSLIVQAGDGAKFPTVPFNCTVWPVGEQPISTNAEIVRVTNISTDTFTITRIQEDTSARAIVVGDQVANTITVKTLTDAESHAFSVDELSDVVTPTPAKNDHFIFNGTSWVNAPSGTTFTFSCTAFDDGLTTGILAGSGVWKADEAITFSATYNNGPPTTADVKMSINGGAYNDVGNMDGPAYTSGKNYDGDINYPTVDQYLRFRLDSSDGTDSDIDYAASLYFYNYIYYGIDNINDSFAEADVEALTGTISPSYTTSRALNATAGNYLVIAYPSRYTSIHTDGFIFNSVTCPFEAAETVALTNTAGLTENYKVFASTNPSLGNSTLVLSTSSSLIDKLYYGVSTDTSGYNEADVEGLANSAVSNDNTQVWNSVTAGVGEYLLFAFPTRLGIPVFYVGGFEGGFESPETVSVTNVNGYTEDYYVWRSTNSGLGATVVETKAT